MHLLFLGVQRINDVGPFNKIDGLFNAAAACIKPESIPMNKST